MAQHRRLIRCPDIPTLSIWLINQPHQKVFPAIGFPMDSLKIRPAMNAMKHPKNSPAGTPGLETDDDRRGTGTCVDHKMAIVSTMCFHRNRQVAFTHRHLSGWILSKKGWFWEARTPLQKKHGVKALGPQKWTH